MKISINIETDNPDDLVRVGNALASVMAETTTTEKPTAPRRAAPKAETQHASTATNRSSAPVTTPENTAPSADTGPTATTDAYPSETTAATITDADLNAAANAAVAKLGIGGVARVKEWVGTSFQKLDGSAGTLMTTREDQRPALIRGLQEIGQGVKFI
jgi:hypothetical protein